MEKVTEKATNFKAASDLLAKGLYFDDNAVVMLAAVKNEDGSGWDCTITQNGNVQLIGRMLAFYVSEFLEDLDEESRNHFAGELVGLILRTKEKKE